MASPPEPAPPQRRRLARRLLLSSIALAAVLVLAVFSLRIPPVGTAVANLILARVSLVPDAALRAREARGDWLSHLELRGLRLARRNAVLASADTLRARYDLLRLLRGEIRVGSFDLAGATVSPRLFAALKERPRTPGRKLTLQEILGGRFYRGPALRVDRLAVRGVVDRDDVHLEARDITLGGDFAFALDSLLLRLRPPGNPPAAVTLTARGTLRDGRLDLPGLALTSAGSDVRARGTLGAGAADSLPVAHLSLAAKPLQLSDLELFLGGPRPGEAALEGALALEADLAGSALDRMSGTLEAHMERGVIGGLRLGRSHLAAAVRGGRADVDLEATAEEAPVSIRGWIRPLDADPAYDVVVKAPRLPARLPGAPWWRDIARRAPLAVGFRVRGHGYSSAVLVVEGRAHGDVGALELRGSLDRSHGLAWTLDRLVLEDFDIARVAGAETESRMNAVLTARGGREPKGPHRASARLDLDSSSYGTRTIGPGHLLAGIDGPRGGASLRIDIDGAALSVDTLDWRTDGTSPFHVRGARLRAPDLARLTGSSALPGELDLALDLDGSGLASLRAPGGAAEALRAGRLGARGRARIEPSRIRGRQIHRADIGLRLVDGQLALEGSLDSDAGRLSAELLARPFDAAPVYRLRKCRFDGLDAGAWAGSPGLASDLAGDLDAEARLAPAAHGARPALESWTAGLRLDRSRLRSLRIPGGDIRAGGTGRIARLAGTLDTEGGDVRLEAGLSAADTVPVARGRFDVPLGVLTRLAGRDTLRAAGGLSLAFEAVDPRRGPAGMSASGRISGSGSIERATLDSLLLAFHLHRGVIEVDTLALRSNLASASVTGSVVVADSIGRIPRTVRTARLHAEVRVLDIAPLAPLLGADSMSLGSGSVALDVSGPARSRAFALNADLGVVSWNSMRLTSAKCAAAGTLGSGWRADSAHARVEIGRLSLGATRIPSARFLVEQGDDLVRFDADVALGARDSLRLAGTLASDSSGWTVHVARLDRLADSTRWRLARPARLRGGRGRFEVEDFEAVSADGSIAAHGILDRHGAQSFRAEVRRAGLEILSPWLRLGALRGSLDGLVEVAGPAADPKATGRLLASFRTAGGPVGDVRATLAWDAAGMDLASAFSSPEGDSIRVAGRLPVGLSLAPSDSAAGRERRARGGPTDLRIAADRFPLRAIAPILAQADVNTPAGTLSMDMRIRGDGRGFTGDGRIEVAGGRVELAKLGARYDDLALRAAWKGDRCVIEELSALAGKGRIEARGSARIASLTKIEPDVSVTLDRAVLVDTRDMRVAVAGDAHVGGSFTVPVVKGRLRFAGCRYLVPQDAFTAGARASIQLSPEELRELEEAFTYIGTTTPNAVAAFYERSDLDLTLLFERNNWVNQTTPPRFSAEITGEVQLRKPPHGELLLVGRLEPTPHRGFVEQFGRTFDLTGGEVLLNGGMKTHTMSIHAEYGNRGGGGGSSGSGPEVVVRLDLEGRMDELRLILSSDPPLSETDIVNYIATGRTPTARVGGTQGSQSDAASLGKDIGLSQVTGALEGPAKQTVGLDVLKVRYDAIEGATLVAGRYVAPQIYVGFQQPLQAVDSANENNGEQYQTRVELDYAAYRWLALNVQAETSLVRSFLRFKREY